MNERFLVATLATASFAVLYSSNVIAPLVTQMAADFGTTPGSIGVVAAAYALPGLITGAITGPFSDRHGRRPFLVGGTSVLGIGTILSAFAPDLTTVTILRCAAGVGATVVLPNMMSAAADRFASKRRARVISTLFIANTVGGLAGITASGIVAQRYGWRAALVLAGAIALAAAAAMAVAPLRRMPPSSVPFLGHMRSVLADRSTLALLASNYLGAMALQTWAIYIVVFFERQYALERDIASTYALVLGAGLLIGTQLGPSMVARLGPRVALAASLCGYGLVLVGVTSTQPALPLAAGAILAAAVLYGLRATSNAVLMTEQIPAARSTVLGLSATTVSAANATSATAGGFTLDTLGFPAIGVFCMLSAALSAALVIGLVKEVDGASTAESGAGPIIPTT